LFITYPITMAPPIKKQTKEWPTKNTKGAAKVATKTVLQV